MSRIKDLFQTKKEDILNIYFTAGYPELNDTTRILTYLQDSGVDMVEIGLPFSDPLADGPVIQASSQQALHNGMSLKVLFDQLNGFRDKISMPVVLMGYLNPILKFGLENFLNHCEQVGVDGLILPDLPIEEYERNYQEFFKKFRVDNILLVTPETSNDRLREIDRLSQGFIYAVSSSSTTGKDKDWTKQAAYFRRLNESGLNNPVLTGFGVKDRKTFKAASRYTNGAIIGSAFINAIQKDDNLEDNVKSFIKGIL